MRPFRPTVRSSLVLALATAWALAAAGCSGRGNGSDGQDAPGSAGEGNGVQAPGGPASTGPLAEPEASGRLTNRAVWPAPVSGEPTPRRSFFTFAAPAAGVFYAVKLVITPVGCDVRQLGARLFAGRLAADGRLE